MKNREHIADYTVFLVFCFITITLGTWMSVHNFGAIHVIALIGFIGVCVLVWPFKRKKLPRINPAKKLKWTVDYWGTYFPGLLPMKFSTYKVAHAYFKLISEKVYERNGISRLSPITADRANNPIMVIFLTPKDRRKQLKYIDGKRDGRERVVRPNQENCTSLLA